uniref:Protein-lysine N-methyltransferase SMYD4 n=1 Tax=Nothobranchius kadleci TaxID=1051664 RepID=A0A1A8CE94_NOTKA
MDLPDPQWQQYVALKWNDLNPELKEKFTSLLEIDDVFKFALNLTNQNELDFLQSVSTGHLVEKDPEEAAKSRERGNSSFKAKHYKAAALHYSQGICLAPQSSEQLCLCYANRSAALYHLQGYQECLGDINKALDSDYPTHLSHKLLDRRSLCLNHLAGRENKSGADGSPASKKNESAAGGDLGFGTCVKVSVEHSAEKGRHLLAGEYVAAGEVILVDRPYSCVLIPGKRGGQEVFGMEQRCCHWCLAETLSPVQCEGCSYSRYCSAACQRAAWEEHHRWECPLGADLIAMGVVAHLALRVTLKAGLANIQEARRPIEQKNLNPNSDPYRSVFHLLHHITQHSAALRFLCAVTIATLCRKLSKGVSFPESWRIREPSSSEEGGAEGNSELWEVGSAALRHMLQLRCNAQAITSLLDTGAETSLVQSTQEVRVATAIFPTLSLLNHSCNPNTSLVFSTGTTADLCGPDESADIGEGLPEVKREARGVTVTVRAARPIKPQQEILHCYGPHSSRMVTQERQSLLQEQYYFLCQCEACSLQEGQQQWSGTRGGRNESGLLCYKCKGALKKNCDNRGDFTCSLLTCGHCMRSAEVSNNLQEVRDVLEKAVELMEREMPEEALQLLKRTKGASGLMLGETHPLQGELADATARAYASMGDWKNAAAHLEQSVAATGSQFGEDSIELGRQLFKLAQLHFNSGTRGPALSVIPKARRIFYLHCGPQCPELQELKAMEECLQAYTCR